MECKQANATHFGSGVHGCGGGCEPPTFGLRDLTHLSMRVGLYISRPRDAPHPVSKPFPDHSGCLVHYCPIARAT